MMPRWRAAGGVLRDAWGLGAPYLRSAERGPALLLLGAIVGLYLAMTGLDVMLNAWNGAFYDTLQQRDASGFLALLLWGRRAGRFMPGWLMIILPYVGMTVLSEYLLQWLQIRWRRWMTQHVLERWLADHAYYRIGLSRDAARDPLADNPDQRIADDLASFCTTTLSLGLDLFSSAVSLATFVTVLWRLSGAMVVWGVRVPGFMVWAGLGFALVGTLASHLVGRRLVGLDFERERVEANFRFGLMQVRERAEAVALSGGEAAERRELADRFGEIRRNWFALLRRRAALNTMVLGYTRAEGIFPLAVGAPRFFAGRMSFGDLTRMADAFAQVQAALSWFVTSYAALAAWAAVVRRLASFERAIAQAKAAGGIERGAGAALSVDLRLDLPDGAGLAEVRNLALRPGSTTLLQGPPGCGKSTLLRAIAGIWPYGAGRVGVPAGRMVVLPQHPYVPAGMLRAALLYPDVIAGDDAMRGVLQAVGLGGLGGRLDEAGDWGRMLSAGEQQLLAIARAVLQAPDWLLLDEATAHLDADAKARVYRVLRERLPGAAIMSTGHDPGLAALHDRVVQIGGLLAGGMDGG